MIKTKLILTTLLILIINVSFSQDGRSLILIHNYADKATIDAITNPTEGNIAYDADENVIYDFDGTNWILASQYYGTTGSVFLLIQTEV